MRQWRLTEMRKKSVLLMAVVRIVILPRCTELPVGLNKKNGYLQ